MIIRKPYAFLIKNFKRIHILLLVLSLYVGYKAIDTYSFIGDFINYGIYDAYSNPITSHITLLFRIVIVLMIVLSVALLFLLSHKGKPWKLYLVPIIEYLVLLIILGIISSFFKNYTYGIDNADIRFVRDLLLIFLICHLACIGVFAMRVFGLDYNKFRFNIDEEFLELSEEDREEVEIALDIDINSFKRLYRRFFRNVNYFYVDHRKTCNLVLSILFVVLSFNIYKYFFVTHRQYKEGDFYSANGLTIRVNKSYFTDKDYHGDIVSKDSNFIVVSFTITNRDKMRKINMENFHVKNGVDDYITTGKTYEKEFNDFGECYDKVHNVKRDEEINFIIVFKVDKKYGKNGFVLYYQEKDGYLRRIKLKLNDVRKIGEVEELKLGDTIEIPVKGSYDTVSFDFYDIRDKITYVSRNCSYSGCVNVDVDFATDGSYKIMDLTFGSEYATVKNMVDFLTKYGKINYKDSNGEDEVSEVVNAISKQYYGKSVFLRVPNDVATSNELSFDFIIRNKHYVYKLT